MPRTDWRTDFLLEATQPSLKNWSDLDRVKKVAVRTKMWTEYKSYKSSLKSLKLESLEQRKEPGALRYALQCTSIHIYKYTMYARHIQKDTINHEKTPE